MGERVHRSVMNIKVGMLFYILSLFLAFFSRKVFLDCLGAEFIGLTGMLMNILNFLSIAELGIGTSIVYFLYKPLQEFNKGRTNEIMSVLSYLYFCVGIFIGLCGFIVSLFFPWWYGNLSTDMYIVYFAYYTFLASSVMGYVFNYRQLILTANQKRYITTAYLHSFSILQSLLQIIAAYYFQNVYLWIGAVWLCTIGGCIALNYRVAKEYPWLRMSLREGKQKMKRYSDVLIKTRQIFIHNIKDFILYRSDEILVGAFVSVVQVAFYGNYTIITNKLNFLVNILSDGMSAGAGNLVAEGNEKNTMKVFWELTAIRFLIVGFIVFSLAMYIQPLILCWVGKDYRLSDFVVYLLIFNIFIMLSRGVVSMFISAYGLFSDTWTAWVELVLNLIVTLCLAPFWGIAGILLGKIISVAFFAILWKPYFLFSKGFHKSIYVYWKGMTKYYLIFILFCPITFFLKNNLIEPFATTFPKLIGIGCITFFPLITLYFLSLYIGTNGMKAFVSRKAVINNKLKFLYDRKSN